MEERFSFQPAATQSGSVQQMGARQLLSLCTTRVQNYQQWTKKETTPFASSCNTRTRTRPSRTLSLFAKRGGLALIRRSNAASYQPLQYALKLGETHCQVLLDAAADPRATDAHGNTALHLLAKDKRVDKSIQEIPRIGR